MFHSCQTVTKLAFCFCTDRMSARWSLDRTNLFQTIYFCLLFLFSVFLSVLLYGWIKIHMLRNECVNQRFANTIPSSPFPVCQYFLCSAFVSTFHFGKVQEIGLYPLRHNSPLWWKTRGSGDKQTIATNWLLSENRTHSDIPNSMVTKNNETLINKIIDEPI